MSKIEAYVEVVGMESSKAARAIAREGCAYRRVSKGRSFRIQREG